MLQPSFPCSQTCKHLAICLCSSPPSCRPSSCFPGFSMHFSVVTRADLASRRVRKVLHVTTNTELLPGEPDGKPRLPSWRHVDIWPSAPLLFSLFIWMEQRLSALPPAPSWSQNVRGPHPPLLMPTHTLPLLAASCVPAAAGR